MTPENPTAVMVPPLYTVSSFSDATLTHLALKIHLLQLYAGSSTSATLKSVQDHSEQFSTAEVTDAILLHTLCSYLKVGMETRIPCKALQ